MAALYRITVRLSAGKHHVKGLFHLSIAKRQKSDTILMASCGFYRSVTLSARPDSKTYRLPRCLGAEAPIVVCLC